MRVTVAAVLLSLVGCGVGRSPAPAPADSRAVVSSPDASSIDVIWVGHATALIRLDDRWILTDPNFSDRVGLVYERYVAPGLRPEDLPRLDAVLVSHAHLDHLDAPSLRAVPASTAVIAPPDAMSSVPKDRDLGRRISLEEWASTEIDGLTITAVPARHGHGRYYVDALWRPRSAVGYVISYGPHVVYFAGDTGYDPAVARAIRRRFPHIDVALLPVGPADRPGWVHSLRKSVHAGPGEALALFDAVGAQWMIPIHYGTFFKRTRGEHRAIAEAVAQHGRHRQVRMLGIGGSSRFYH
jgi:L-ascorbate metabolism protein UlaG (beta-lactamase superfamily)